mmetsp:Transcript_392/g.1135  ORF Transcript_392/g.1135 Transcript_392/m.1135 type:complete len:331 (+) Transcript_392:590-1582(+)
MGASRSVSSMMQSARSISPLRESLTVRSAATDEAESCSSAWRASSNKVSNRDPSVQMPSAGICGSNSRGAAESAAGPLPPLWLPLAPPGHGSQSRPKALDTATENCASAASGSAVACSPAGMLDARRASATARCNSEGLPVCRGLPRGASSMASSASSSSSGAPPGAVSAPRASASRSRRSSLPRPARRARRACASIARCRAGPVPPLSTATTCHRSARRGWPSAASAEQAPGESASGPPSACSNSFDASACNDSRHSGRKAATRSKASVTASCVLPSPPIADSSRRSRACSPHPCFRNQALNARWHAARTLASASTSPTLKSSANDHRT